MLFEIIDETIKRQVDNNLLPGVVYGVCAEGKILFKNSYGFANRRKDCLNGKSIFRLASMTKPITAVATLIAEEMGLLSIEDKISKHIPEMANLSVGEIVDGKVVFKEKVQREITIKDILTHSSGLGSLEVGNYYFGKRTIPKTLKEAVDEYKNWHLDFQPGKRQFYSAVVALDVVARIIEIVSKQSYQEFLRKYLFDPLEMKDTTYKLKKNQVKRLVDMYNLNSDQKGYTYLDFGTKGFDCFEEGFPSGTAGLFSTFDDYMNFTIMLASNGVFKGYRILTEKSVEKLRSPALSKDVEGVTDTFNWGLSVYVRGDNAPWQCLPRGSYGWSGAYNTHFFIIPHLKLGAVYMSNINNAGGAGSETAREFEGAIMKSLKGKRL